MKYNSKKAGDIKRTISIIYNLLIFIVICQYFNLQILNYKKYQLKAGNNSLRKIVLNAPRGIIYDRNGEVIVANKRSFSI